MLLRSAAVFRHSVSATYRAQHLVAKAMHSAPQEQHNAKKRAMVRIGTHDGTFHCDEALGVYILRRTAVSAGATPAACVFAAASHSDPASWTQAFKDAEVVRTRVPEVLNDLDIVLDVGAVYDPGAQETLTANSARATLLVHTPPDAQHTRCAVPRAQLVTGMTTTRRSSTTSLATVRCFPRAQAAAVTSERLSPPRSDSSSSPASSPAGFTTRLSSAGLVYKHFGKEVIASVLGTSPEDSKVTTVWLQVYKTFMEAIDGIDNGVNQYEGLPKYQSNTNLSSRVGNLNPTWLQESTPQLLDAQFEKAVQLAGGEWLEAVQYTANVWLPGRAPVAEALAARHSVHPSGRIVQLMQYCPWKSHLYDLEEEMGLSTPDKQPWFVLYEDEKKNWRVQAISVGPNSFENRKGLPTAWRGLRDEQLSAESGVPGSIFVHVTGFIGGNATLQGAKDMAIKALALD